MNDIAAFEGNLPLYARADNLSEDEFIRSVGMRVRMARARRGICLLYTSDAADE